MSVSWLRRGLKGASKEDQSRSGAICRAAGPVGANQR
jgi:hypothetical protein